MDSCLPPCQIGCLIGGGNNMMRAFLTWISFIFAMFSAPAHAAHEVAFLFDVDLTAWERYSDGPNFYENITHLGSGHYYIRILDEPPFEQQGSCFTCLRASFEGNQLLFKPVIWYNYGYQEFRFLFDHDLGGKLPVTNAGFLGGQFTEANLATSYPYSRGLDGPITRLSVYYVPEISTWAMMIAGFFAVGLTMRSRINNAAPSFG